MAHAMSYRRVRLGFVAPCCGLLELAMDAAELKLWLASVARLNIDSPKNTRHIEMP